MLWASMAVTSSATLVMLPNMHIDMFYDVADDDDDENAKREHQAEAPKVNARQKHR